MKGIYIRKDSSYYWFSFYDKFESAPKKRIKKISTKIKITNSDKQRFLKGMKPIGTPQLNKLITSFREALTRRQFESMTNSTVRKELYISDLLNNYVTLHPALTESSIKVYQYAVNRFISNLKERPISSYSDKDYYEFINQLKITNTNRTTINTISKHLKVLFNYAIKQNLISNNIIKVIPAPAGIPLPIPIDDLKTILNYYNSKELYLSQRKVSYNKEEIKEQRLIVHILLYTGIRKSSLLRLTLSDIDYDNKVIIIRNVKGKKNFVFPLFDKLKLLLQNCEGKIIKRIDKRFSFWNRDIQKLVEMKLIKKKYQLHSLRDTFSTLLASSGVDVAIVQELLNHSDIKTTKEHYLLIDSNKKKQLLENAFSKLLSQKVGGFTYAKDKDS